MRKIIGILMFFFLVCSFACKHNANEAGGKQNSGESGQDNSESIYPLVEVPVGNRVIVGKRWTGSVPDGTHGQIIGCFVEGRKVKLSPYEIGKYEVNYKLWKDVCKWATEHGYTGLENVGNVGNSEKDGADIPREQWDMQPVTKMTWPDAVVWCNAFTEMRGGSEEECVYRDNNGNVLKNATDIAGVSLAKWENKKGYRLPTQAEWEAAARYSKDSINATNYAESGEPIYFTNHTSASGGKLPIAFAGIKESSDFEGMKAEFERLVVCRKYFDGKNYVEFNRPNNIITSVIGSRAPNDLGCYDMSGNVNEYCYDWSEWILTFDKNNIEVDPRGPSAPSRDDHAKVFRGGYSFNLPYFSSVTYVDWMETIDMKTHDVGIRLARTK